MPIHWKIDKMIKFIKKLPITTKYIIHMNSLKIMKYGKYIPMHYFSGYLYDI